MPLEEAKLPIPIGAGVNNSIEDHALEPPHAAVVSNMRPVSTGSYRKRPGWKNIYAASVPEFPTLIGGEDQCLLMGNSPARIIDTTSTRDTTFGAPYPFTVSRVGVMAGNGFIHSVQCTSSASYTAVIVSQVGDTQVSAGSATTAVHLEEDYECVGVILDAEDKIVWGPHKFPSTLKVLPRVEATDDGKFVFFACSGAETAFNLYMSFADVASDVAPTVNTTLGRINYPGVVGGTNQPRSRKVYDTTTAYVAGTPGKAYVCWTLRSGASRSLDVRSTTAGTVVDTASKALAATTDRENVACLWDQTSLTLLALETTNQDSYGFKGDLSTDSGVVATGSLLGINAASGVDELTRPHVPVPVLFHDHNGVIRLNELAVSMSGSDPATPSYGAAIAEFHPMLYEPALLGTTDTLYFWGGMGSRRQGADPSYTASPAIRGASSIEVYHMATHPSFATARPLIDAVIGESRLGEAGHKLYTWWDGNPGETGDSASEELSPCVTGQLGSLGGIMVPHVELTSAQHNRETLDVWAGTTVSDENLGYTAAVRLHDGAGHYNDEQMVVLTRLVAGTPIYSQHSHENSKIIGGGMLSAWSHDRVHPAAIRPCAIGDITGDADSPIPGPPSDGRKLLSSLVGVDPDSDQNTGEIKWHTVFLYRLVMVYTDANGVEYRSMPSFNSPEVQIGTGEDSDPTYCPVIDVYPHPQMLAMWDTMGALDVEVYATARTNGDGSTVPDESTFTLVNRMPLQHDAAGYFVIDTLQDFVLVDIGGGTAGPWTVGLRSPPHTNALYTITEAAAEHPPAMHAMAHAGEYLFGVSAEDDYELWVSKPLSKGRAPEWSPLLTLLLPPSSGGCVSLAGSYDRLYALCRNGVWELPAVGGFTAAGTGSFPPFRLTFIGDPCSNHMGTVSTPLGAFYATLSGPRLIQQDGSVTPIGDAVRDLLGWGSVSGSVYIPADNEVLWFDTSQYVAFDLKTQGWSHGSFTADSVARLGSVPIRVTSNGVLRQDTATPDSLDFVGEVRSPWIDLDDVAGYKRVVEALVRGRLEGTPTSGALNIQIRYNYVDTVVDTMTWAGTDIDALVDGLMLAAKPSRQKCHAIQIGIVETKTGGEAQTDMDWSVTGMALRIRQKRGMAKTEAGARK